MLQLQDAVFFLHAALGMGGRILGLAPDVQAVAGFGAQFRLFGGMGGPQAVYGFGKAAQLFKVAALKGPHEFLAPVFGGLHGLGHQLFDVLVVIGGHAVVGQEKVIDLLRAAGRRGRDPTSCQGARLPLPWLIS